jgi:glycosyltransferase involved in cell wall biosynthesis
MFAKEVLSIAKRIKPSIIHSHSPFYCGLIASWVSKRLGIPSVYELRGVWEGAFPSFKSSKSSLSQKVFRFLENSAMQRADDIVVISDHLKDELSSRGLYNKIHVIHNGVDTARFNIREKSRTLSEKLNLGGKVVLGYIGTFSADYEGLDYLIKALPLIIKERPEAVLLLVGDGRLKAPLEAVAERAGVKGHVIFTGRIPWIEWNLRY